MAMKALSLQKEEKEGEYSGLHSQMYHWVLPFRVIPQVNIAFLFKKEEKERERVGTVGVFYRHWKEQHNARQSEG
jgi:hypothetical protein